MRPPLTDMWRAALVTLLVLAAPSGAVAEHVLTTEHLRVSGDVPFERIDEAGVLGEALYTALAKHFGKSPDRGRLPIELRLHPDFASMKRSLRAAGIRTGLEGLGGYTTDEGVSHVAMQKEAFDTRRLVLHELTHAFQDRVVPFATTRRVPAWYREGLAEWFGWHRRTKDGVVFGALDAVAYRQRPALAALRVREDDFDPWAVMTAPVVDYTDALAVVAALMRSEDTNVRRGFRAFEKTLLRQGVGQGGVLRRFVTDEAVVTGAIRSFWQDFELPWRARTFGFDEEPGGFVGRADDDAWLEAGTQADGLEVTLDPFALDADGAAGVVLERLTADTGVSIVVGSAGLAVARGTNEPGPWPLPGKAGGPIRLQIVWTADGVEVEVERGGKRRAVRVAWQALGYPADWKPSGRIGLVVTRGSARFRGVVLR